MESLRKPVFYDHHKLFKLLAVIQSNPITTDATGIRKSVCINYGVSLLSTLILRKMYGGGTMITVHNNECPVKQVSVKRVSTVVYSKWGILERLESHNFTANSKHEICIQLDAFLKKGVLHR